MPDKIVFKPSKDIDMIDKASNPNFIQGFQNTLLEVATNRNKVPPAILKLWFYDSKNALDPEMFRGAMEVFDFIEGKKPERIKNAIFAAIILYTVRDKKVLLWLKKQAGIKAVRINNDYGSAHIVLDSGLTIQFSLLSQFLDDFCGITPGLKRELESAEREGMCHIGSRKISQILGIRNDVVSGYISNFGDDRVLHSWIEASMGRKKMVLDPSLNAIINVEGYDYLTGAQRKSTISSELIKKDINDGVFDLMEKLKVNQGDRKYLVDRGAFIEYLHRLREESVQEGDAR